MALTNNLFIGVGGWASGTYAVGDIRSNAGNGYMCVRPGSSTGAPTGTGSLINNGGTAWWAFCAAIDFSDLPTAQGSLPATFSQPIIWQFWNCGPITTSFNTPILSIFGQTTTPTNNLTLTTAPGQSFRDALRLGVTPLVTGASGVSILLPAGAASTDYLAFDINITIDGLQFQDPTPDATSAIMSIYNSAVVSRCIFDAFGQGERIYVAGSGVSMTNNLIIDRQVAGSDFITFDTGATGSFVNNGMVAVNSPAGASVGVRSNSGSAAVLTVKNTYFFGYGTPLVCQNAAGSIVVDHCCTDLATGAFTSTVNGLGCTDNGNELFAKSAANQFISVTSDLRLKAGADCLNAGVTDTTDIPSADDIARTHRPQGSAWDIGPWERPAPSNSRRRSPMRIRL